MKTSRSLTALLTAIAVTAPALAAAQEPVREFSQLNTRLKPGDAIWVTDAQGRETGGRILSLSADALTLEGAGGRTFGSPDVTTIKLRRHDSLANGALIGLGVGGVTFGAACYASMSGSDQDWCPLVAVFYGGVGLAVGVGIDALIPGPKLVAYRAPGSTGPSQARFSIAPVVTRRAKGLAVAFSF